MKEIRICWLPTVVHDNDYRERVNTCSGWRAVSPDSVRDMQALCDAANQVFGPRSHWIETRDAPLAQ